MEPRLKTSLWVQSQIRLCDQMFFPISITRKGDPDSGALILRLNKRNNFCQLFRRIISNQDFLDWMSVGGADMISFEDAAGYLEREITRDRDLWIIEIDDFANKYIIQGSRDTI